jgi:hypothetical protein
LSWFDELPEHERSKVKGVLGFSGVGPVHVASVYDIVKRQ